MNVSKEASKMKQHYMIEYQVWTLLSKLISPGGFPSFIYTRIIAGLALLGTI